LDYFFKYNCNLRVAFFNSPKSPMFLTKGKITSFTCVLLAKALSTVLISKSCTQSREFRQIMSTSQLNFHPHCNVLLNRKPWEISCPITASLFHHNLQLHLLGNYKKGGCKIAAGKQSRCKTGCNMHGLWWHIPLFYRLVLQFINIFWKPIWKVFYVFKITSSICYVWFLI
jgi:hypothetical protein